MMSEAAGPTKHTHSIHITLDESIEQAVAACDGSAVVVFRQRDVEVG